MAEPKSVPGSCLCGAIQFEVDLPTLFCAHCHCSMCRRAHGAGYVTWIGVPKTQFRVVGGGDQLRTYRSSEHGIRQFCGTCGSSMFCEIEHDPPTVDIVLANLDAPIDREPQLHIFYDSGASWAQQVDDKLPKLGGKTGSEPL
jgi:hypothetical protein